MLTFFGVEYAKGEMPPTEAWPLGLAPFIRLTDEGQEGGKPALLADDGQFGLHPHFATEVAYGRKTYNARSETVAKLASFRRAWGRGQRCIIPAEGIFEPCYESGKAVRWLIQQRGGVPMGIAGIYETVPTPNAKARFSFAMLTVNADGHPVFQRMHKPEDEKRMVVILREEDYMPWLTCSLAEAPRFFRQYEGPLDAMAAPLAPRTRRPKDGNSTPPDA